ncbi:hypothetical protein ACFVSW_21005 [Neobacillus sp. NPDC058068]|uniref:hypothetical protein n=1 Tax=Neobacillus sp. NPDC058068 TaxID=3346325 RepID=UPI0036D8EBC8
MYQHPFHYQTCPWVPFYPTYMVTYQLPRTYPPVDTKIFASSVKSFRLLMEQGSILLDRLGNLAFAHKMMTAAQQGKNAEVDRMIKSIGLKVPVTTQFSPTGVNFILSTDPSQNQSVNCCSLTISMKWGR